MFKSISMTGSGLVLVLLHLVLMGIESIWGVKVNVLPGELEGVASKISDVIGYALLVIGQVRRPDLVAGFIRR